MSTNDAETTVLTKTPASPPLDPINPYAVISLVAALLSLFPVAIVFGILAFTRPAGRGIAIAGLVLGILELAALLLVFFGIANAFTDDSDSLSTAQTVTSSVFEPFTTTDETTTSTPTPATEPETPSPTTTEPEPSPATGPALNETCTEGQANALATDVNTGNDIVCAFLGSGGGFKWVQSAPVSPGSHERGDLCNPATDKVGRSTGGTALLCVADSSGSGAGSWEPGP